MMSRLVAALALGLTAFPAQAAGLPGRDFLTPRMSVGDHISDIFSIASSVTAEGFDQRVARNSGSADYTLTQVSRDAGLTFLTDGLYDGAARYHAVDIIGDGGASSCFNGACATYTDASGPLYNRLLWGRPPAKLKAGMTWTVDIAQPWELGPPGRQTVTVIHLDRTDGTAILKREGRAVGAFAKEPGQVTLNKGGRPIVLDVTPGEAHWTGYTRFRHGVVLSDELLVERTDELRSAETGPVRAVRRRYMLLNAAPYPTL